LFHRLTPLPAITILVILSSASSNICQQTLRQILLPSGQLDFLLDEISSRGKNMGFDRRRLYTSSEIATYRLEKRQKMSKSSISKQSQTDWDRLEALEDQEIDVSDIPELTPEMFAKAVVKRGLKDKEGKTQLTIRVDRNVLAWFKAQGRGYQTRINSLLRA
jgi:uncharacterized protein (DUF4415 family)